MEHDRSGERSPEQSLSTTFLFRASLSAPGRSCTRDLPDPTPHSFVTLSSTTKLGLGLPNKVMSTCVLSKLELDESKKYSEREFSFQFFSSSFVRVL